MTDIRFAMFGHARDNRPKAMSMTWDQFVAGAGPHKYHFADKKACPMFCPAEFREGAPRVKKNVLRIWFGVLDLDKIPLERLNAVCDILRGHDAILYTTWSHNDPERRARDLWTVRVCVRFSRPVEAKEWSHFWGAMSSYFGGNDPSCKDPNRCYFMPAAPSGTDPATMHYVVFRGQPLDVDRIIAQPVLVSIPERKEKIGRDRLSRLAKRWKQSRDPYRSELGEALGQLCKGEAFAEPGNIDNMVFQLCQDLAKALPEADPSSIAEHFAQSLQLMAWKGEYPLSRVQEKLERAQERIAEDEAAAELEQVSARKIRIREAFAGVEPEREHSYTEQEIRDLQEICKCSREELQKRWIIQRGSSYYVLGPGGCYSPPYTEKDVYSAIVRDLAPADTADVDLWEMTETGGKRRKLPSTLMSEYGSVATSTILDLRAQRASYEPAQKLFIEAPCPLRKLTPQYDPDVDAWLEIVMGHYYDDVKNWLAQVTNLDLTCAALLLIGPKDTGKSLLAFGLSRLWTESGPTPLESALSDFNDKIAHCPLIFADEQLPKDFRGFDRTSEIRRFISEMSRPLKRKHLPESTIIGAIRLVCAANNENILAMREHLTAHDIEAIGDRFYLVKMNQKQAIVNGIPLFDKAGIPITEPAYFLSLCDTKSFVEGDRIAKHVLWLRDTYPTRRDGRFLVQSKDREFYRGLATQSGIRSAVCEWCIRYLLNPARLDARGDFGVLIQDHKLYVRPTTILDTWDIFVTNEHIPATGILSRTVRELAVRRRHLAKPLRAGDAHYWEIDTKHLYAWGEQTGFAEREQIDAVLKVDTEIRILAPPVRQNA